MNLPSTYADARLAEHAAHQAFCSAIDNGDTAEITRARLTWQRAAKNLLEASASEPDLGPRRLS